MNISNVQQNQIPNEPELKDLLALWKKAILLGLNCHHIGTVQSFDSVKQTATATINYKKTFFEPDPVTGVYGPVLKDYPILLDCPVIVLGGGGGALTFPNAQGDECVVLFNDRDIDNWFQGGGSGAAVATPRLHSFSDGLILVGVRSLANVLKNYDAVRAVLRLGQAMVGVGGGAGTLVKIANGTTTLNTLLQSLLTDLSTLATSAAAGFTTQAGASTGPLSPLAAGFTALAATFTSFGTGAGTLSTQIAGLLE